MRSVPEDVENPCGPATTSWWSYLGAYALERLLSVTTEEWNDMPVDVRYLPTASTTPADLL